MKRIALSLLFLVAVSFVLSACSTPDTKNTSARPWSSPRTWEHGLPTGITEGR